jgi:hypothetical protein
MEHITVQYRDDQPDASFEDDSLMDTWVSLSEDPNVLYARYRVPARYTPSRMRTYGVIGISRGEAARAQIETDLDLAREAAAVDRTIAARTWTYNGHRDSLPGK